MYLVDKKITRNDCKMAVYELQILDITLSLSNGKSMKNYLQVFLWIFLDRIIVQAPSICYFKGLCMRYLEHEIRFCQKTHTKVTMSTLWQFFWNRLYSFYCVENDEAIIVIFIWLLVFLFRLSNGLDKKITSY